jgi:NADPH-dependent 2,4-dienoyl-CoA reductase/sulfur reductase-like enzyme
VSLELALDEACDDAHLRARVAQALGAREHELPVIALRKRSIDARRGTVRFRLLLELGAIAPGELAAPHPRAVGPGRVVIVGSGPAGLLSA